MNYPRIQIFIATHNRPESFEKALLSILSQNDSDFELIVSDNSTDERTSRLMKSKYNHSSIRYIRREALLDGIEHLNQIISEADKDYFMIFHDDDILHPECVATVKKKILEYNSPSCIGFPAYIIKNDIRIKESFEKDRIFNNAETLAREYIARNPIAVFPSYFYRTDTRLPIDKSQGGKYADCALILKYAQKGSVVWLSTPLMDYYIHPSQDSAVFSILQYSGLTKIFNNCGIPRDDSELQRFRQYIVYGEWKNFRKNRNKHPHEKLIKRAIFSKFYPGLWIKYIVTSIQTI